MDDLVFCPSLGLERDGNCILKLVMPVYRTDLG